MGLKLKDFEEVIKNKSKEEVLVDAKCTLSACLNEDDQGSLPCGSGRGDRPRLAEIPTSPSDYAGIIGEPFITTRQ